MAKILVFEPKYRLGDEEVKRYEKLLEKAYDGKNHFDPILMALDEFNKEKDRPYISPRITKIILNFTELSDALNELVDEHVAFSGLTFEEIEAELRREDALKEAEDETEKNN